MINWTERLNKAVEKMNKMSISDLRQVARALGVNRPAVGKKERLITDIVAIANGELAPVPLSTRGAPPKSDNFDRALYAEITELRQSCLNKNEPEILSVADSGDCSDFAGVYSGLLYKSSDGYRLKSFAGGEISVREAIVNKFLLRTGDKVKADCTVGADGKPEVTDVISVNGELYGKVLKRPEFANLSRIYAENLINFSNSDTCATLKMTVFFTPLAYGQRVLALTGHRRASTELAKYIINGLMGADNTETIAAFIGCTPEDRVSVCSAVKHDALLFTGFDSDKREQLSTLSLAAEYAKRRAELGKHAVLVIDGFFRPAKSFNKVDTEACAELKKILAAAGAFEAGGSLTVIALSDISQMNNADSELTAEFIGFENAVLNYVIYKNSIVLDYKNSFSDFVCGSQAEAQALKSKPAEDVFKVFLKD